MEVKAVSQDMQGIANHSDEQVKFMMLFQE